MDTGCAERLLERARPGVLFKDLTACNDYRDGLASAAPACGGALCWASAM
jgi:hypothetical protein